MLTILPYNRAGDLFAGLPVKGSQGFYHNFTRTIINLTKTTTVARNLYHLTSASRVQFDNLAAAPFSNIQQGWRVMNPFDTMQELIFKYTLRAMGAQEICEDQKLLAKTLHHFEQFEKHASPASITFPWLLTPNQIIRMWNAIQLYRVFDKIIKDRARTGKPRNDPLQQLIDEGQSIREIVEVSHFSHCSFFFLFFSLPLPTVFHGRSHQLFFCYEPSPNYMCMPSY